MNTSVAVWSFGVCAWADDALVVRPDDQVMLCDGAPESALGI